MPFDLRISSAKIRNSNADNFIDFNGITPAVTTQTINDYLDAHPEMIVNISDNSISSAKLMDDIITADKIAADAVIEEKILDESITTQKLADASVSSDKIQDNSITSDKIDNGTITAEKIVNNAIITEKISDGSIINSKLASNSVGTLNLIDASVTNGKIVDNAITNAKILDSAIITSKINNSAVTTEKLANNSVTTNKIVDSNVTTNKINDSAVTNAKIADYSITSQKLSKNLITAIEASQNALNYNSIDTYFLSYTRPEFFGAKHDNSTDDTAAIQAAINTKKTVIFSTGSTYLVNGALKLLAGTHLDLNNAILTKTVVGHFFQNFESNNSSSYGDNTYNGAGNIVIENGTLRNGGAIRLAHATNITIKNVFFHRAKGYHFIELCACNKVKILDCEFRGMVNNTGGALEYINIDDANASSFPYFDENSPCYDGKPCLNITISNCYFHFSDDNSTHKFGQYAIGCHEKSGSNTTKHNNIIISDNHFEDFTISAINLNNMSSVFITNNIIRTARRGVDIGLQFACEKVYINNNQFFSTKETISSGEAASDLGLIFVGNVSLLDINQNTLCSSSVLRTSNPISDAPALINFVANTTHNKFINLQRTWITDKQTAGVLSFQTFTISPALLNTLYIHFINGASKFEAIIESNNGMGFVANEKHSIPAILYDSESKVQRATVVYVTINEENQAISISHASDIKIVRVAGALVY